MTELPASNAPVFRSDAEARDFVFGAFVEALYRLVKTARVHVEKNQASIASAQAFAETARAAQQRTASHLVSVLFHDSTVFVNGQMLRMSREAYARATDLAAYLEKCGIAEVSVDNSVIASDAMAFVETTAAVTRGTRTAASLLTTRHGAFSVRGQVRRAQNAGPSEDVSPAERVVGTYARGIIILREFCDDLRANRASAVPPAIRRIAQRIVAHVEEHAPLLIGLTAGAGTEPDDAALALQTAIVAALMAFRLTQDRRSLTSLVMAALVTGLGDVAIRSGLSGSELPISRALTNEELDRCPAEAATTLIALERMHPTAMHHTTLAYEALWAGRAHRLGPVYAGRRPPSALTELLVVARKFVEAMHPGDVRAPPNPEEVLARRASSRALLNLGGGELAITQHSRSRQRRRV